VKDNSGKAARLCLESEPDLLRFRHVYPVADPLVITRKAAAPRTLTINR
jgi:hypothetical protein